MLFGWMKSLIFYLLLATIVTHMAPSNQYKQYIRYFIGLVVIVLLASPLNSCLNLEAEICRNCCRRSSMWKDRSPSQESAEASRIIMVWASERDSKRTSRLFG